MCSRTLSDTANRLRKTRKKKFSAVPLFRSGRRSLVCARLTNKGKAGVQRGRETAGVPSSLSPPRTRQSPALRRAQFPAESQRKTPRPSGANTPAAVRVPRSAGTEKGVARKERTRLRSSCAPDSRCLLPDQMFHLIRCFVHRMLRLMRRVLRTSPHRRIEHRAGRYHRNHRACHRSGRNAGNKR